MRFLLFADSHLKHEKMKTYCLRPPNFTEIIHGNMMHMLDADTTLIHLGDVGIAKPEAWIWMIAQWPGRKVLIRGNHDRDKSCAWWMEHGFDFACDGMMFRNWWLSHEPANSRPGGCEGNIHGHLHNIWHGFVDPAREKRDRELLRPLYKHKLKYDWQRLFACEYTDYKPIEFEHFVSHPDKYQSRGAIKP